MTIDPDRDKTLLTDVWGKTVTQISHNNNEEKGKGGRRGIYRPKAVTRLYNFFV